MMEEKRWKKKAVRKELGKKKRPKDGTGSPPWDRNTTKRKRGEEKKGEFPPPERQIFKDVIGKHSRPGREKGYKMLKLRRRLENVTCGIGGARTHNPTPNRHSKKRPEEVFLPGPEGKKKEWGHEEDETLTKRWDQKGKTRR